MTLIAAGVGVVLAIGGMYEMLIPFLVLLGSIIPPVGGVIMADFWYRHRGKYPLLASASLPRYNFTGLFAYAVGAVVAYCSPWVAPLVGIAVAAVCYIVLLQFTARRTGVTVMQGDQ
jgi:cytosine permease